MHSLKHHHTFALDAVCKELYQVSSIHELNRLLLLIQKQPFIFIGEGSNCIFVEDFQGIVAQVQILGKSITQQATQSIVSVGAGENWHEFVSWCTDNQLYGLENLALIPGTVGAAPIQNIGAYGVEVEKFIASVEVVDITTKQTRIIEHSECNFGYRDSVFKKSLNGKIVVTQVNFCFPNQWQPCLSYGELKQLVSLNTSPSPQTIFNKVVAIREQKLPDPKIVGNAGSFFKNPVVDIQTFNDIQQQYPNVPSFVINDTQRKIPAAWFIDTAGFKGQVRGGIQCHPNHALVLTNINNGTGEQLLNFAREIITTIKTQFAVVLENEVRLIGKNGLIIL